MNDDERAQVEFARLQRTYADIATRGAWDEFLPIATPDARFTFDTHSGTVFDLHGAGEFQAFADRMTDRFDFYVYIPLNFVAVLDGDGTARGRAYCHEVGQDRTTGGWVEFYGAYEDRYALFEGSWRFAQRDYRTFARRSDAGTESFPLHAPRL